MLQQPRVSSDDLTPFTQLQHRDRKATRKFASNLYNSIYMYVEIYAFELCIRLQVVLRQTLQVAIATTTSTENARSVELRIMASG